MTVQKSAIANLCVSTMRTVLESKLKILKEIVKPKCLGNLLHKLRTQIMLTVQFKILLC